eukprot:g39652.t1
MSGFCGVYVAFITPALLQYASARSCQRQFGSSATVYSGLHSNNFFVALILLFSVFAICVLTYETCFTRRPLLRLLSSLGAYSRSGDHRIPKFECSFSWAEHQKVLTGSGGGLATSVALSAEPQARLPSEVKFQSTAEVTTRHLRLQTGSVF